MSGSNSGPRQQQPEGLPGLDVDPGERGYAWEGSFSRTWEALQEDATGSLSAVVEEAAASNSLAVQRRKGLLKALLGTAATSTTTGGAPRGSIKRGLLRHLVLVLDFSASLRDKDLFPTRVECMCEEVERFVEAFFQVNPLSHLGLVGTRDGLAFVVAPVTSSPGPLVRALQEHHSTGVDGCSGEPSLGNALDLVHSLLRHVPGHSTRECLFLTSALTSLDPFPVADALAKVAAARIRTSVISLSAEVHLCRKITTATGGSFEVVLDERHFRQCLLQLVYPPPLHREDVQGLIHMGFGEFQRWETPVLCACHATPTPHTHRCPRCRSVVCALPSECPVCGLVLANAPALAKSYHHLFPIPVFAEVKLQGEEHPLCHACHLAITRSKFACPTCQACFCIDCDVYIHDTLFNCPTCV